MRNWSDLHFRQCEKGAPAVLAELWRGALAMSQTNKQNIQVIQSIQNPSILVKSRSIT